MKKRTTQELLQVIHQIRLYLEILQKEEVNIGGYMLPQLDEIAKSINRKDK